MMWAAQMGHLQIVKLCLEEKRLGFVSTDHTALFAASANGHVEVVEFLVSNANCFCFILSFFFHRSFTTAKNWGKSEPMR